MADEREGRSLLLDTFAGDPLYDPSFSLLRIPGNLPKPHTIKV